MQAMTTQRLSMRDLSVLNYAQGFTLWHHRTRDFDAVLLPEFWEDAEDMMQAGDLIHCTSSERAVTLHVGRRMERGFLMTALQETHPWGRNY